MTLVTTAIGAAILGLCWLGRASAQGTFGNLDFESANVPSLPPGQAGFVSVADGLPDWTVYGPGGVAGSIFQNNVSLGGAAVSIMGPQFDPSHILQGQYTAYFVGDSSPISPNWTALGQTGQVPASAMSLRFLVAPASIFQVSFGGVTLPVTYITGNSKESLMGVDISHFAGQTGELRFTALPGQGGYLDFVNFSNLPIPEPSGAALFALGSLSLVLIRRHSQAQ